jgi:phage portal protein BeeE
MGLLSYLRGDDLRDAKTESRSLPAPENELPLLGAYTATSITPAAALAIADVWAAVRVLADAASSLPLHVYRKTSAGRERVTSGRLVDLLERPGPGTSQADLVSSLMAHLAIWGSGYVGKYRRQGEVAQLGLLAPRASPARTRERRAALPLHARPRGPAHVDRSRPRARQGPVG